MTIKTLSKGYSPRFLNSFVALSFFRFDDDTTLLRKRLTPEVGRLVTSSIIGVNGERAMKKSVLSALLFVVLTVLVSGCAPALAPVPTSVPPTLSPSPIPPTATPDPTATPTATPSSWEAYTNETWRFSLEHPTAWVISDNDAEFGFIGKQVFWWVGNYDPLQQPGDVPSVDEMSQLDIDGRPATRIIGHYQGAIGDMGYQQYLKYVVQRGELFYTFTLYAVNALGIPQEMMTETLPLRESDTALFEQMMATLKFRD